MHHSTIGRALALLVVLAGCRESSGPSSDGVPRSIVPVSPTTLTAPVAATVPEPLVARVLDGSERPVRGVRVLFQAPDQMATLDPAEGTTDAQGEVRTTVTLGTTAGRVDVMARIAGSDSSTVFTITATGLAPSRVVALPDPMWMFAPGETGNLYAHVADQHGNAVGSSAITWLALDPAVATVTSTGVVAGVGAGATGRIEVRSAEGFRDTVRVSIADPATTACAGAAVSLAPGESITMDPRDGACVRTAGAGEFVAASFFASEAPTARTGLLHLIGTGIRTGTSGALASPVTQAQLLEPARPLPDERFEHALRLREEHDIAPLARRDRTLAPRTGAGASLNAVPANAVVGDYVTINASPTYACSFPNDDERRRDTRVGRVAAITQRAIVIADTTNPGGGFTDAEYRHLGVTFDTLVAPLDEQLFGTPGDLDANQKIVIFYTARVNQITVGSDSYVGGFFWSRDLLTRQVCGTSNVAEIFYMLVPDPENELGGGRRTKAFVEEVTVGTLAHEYQHLINASRRFADPQADPAEATWLNEGLSHIAEEMLFYRTTGLQPRQNVGAPQLADPVVRERYFDFQHNNVTRLERWLTAPQANSPFGLSSSLATRGAAWAFLRYLADRSATAENTLWFQLVNNRETGVANLEEVFGVDILAAARDWTVAMFADDLVPNLPAAYRFPSWNFRTLYPVIPRGAYPLAVFPMANNAARRIETQGLFGGGAYYATFRTEADVEARVWLRAVAGTPQPAVKVTVLRIR